MEIPQKKKKKKKLIKSPYDPAIPLLVTAVRMVIIGKLRTINVGVDVEKRESSYTVCENEC